MRFIETRQSKVDKEATTYVFVLGKSEVLILQDVLHYVKKVVPKSFYTQPFTSRAKSILKELDKTVLDYDLRRGRKRPKGWDPEQPNETF